MPFKAAKQHLSFLCDTTNGESYTAILRYFFPEFITSFIVFALPFWIDAYFISFLQSTTSYATIGTTNNTIHLLFKLGEAFSVAAVILVGHFNGLGLYEKVGQVFKNTLITTVLVGAFICLALYCGAPFIFRWLEVSEPISALGVPFLRIRSFALFFTFLSFSFMGFFRGIKNTRIPMYAYLAGTISFVLCDYLLIFGWGHYAGLGLFGSAWASVAQSGTMLAVLIASLFCMNDYYHHFDMNLKGLLARSYLAELFSLIWPVAIDKVTLAFAYIWLNKMINSMGVCSSASFCAIKDLERLAFLPAIALAQIITFLVSNEYGKGNFARIKNTLKKVIILAGSMVFTLLGIFSLLGPLFLGLLDKKGEFATMTVQIFPILSVLVLFDLIQLLLAGALRGAGDVKIVMWTRVAVCFGYFVPISYLLSTIPLESTLVKFLLIYSSFYVGNGLMSLVYIARLQGKKWKTHTL